MEKAYLNKSIVIIGDFNPANFDKLFLVKSGVIREDDFDEDSVFLPEYAQISTPNFYIQVNSDRVNINYKNVNFVLEADKIKKLFTDSSISAIGINFKKGLILDNRARSKEFFYFEDNILNRHFQDDNAVYGYFVSKEFADYRLTLNIKPVKLQKIEDPKAYEALDFSFNFRFSGEEILKNIDRVKDLELIVDNIIKDYEIID